jgi:hypothetical protein
MPDFDANDDITMPARGPGGTQGEDEYLTPLVRRARDLAIAHPRRPRPHHQRLSAHALGPRRRPSRRACHGEERVWAVGAFSPPQWRLRSRCHPWHPASGRLD